MTEPPVRRITFKASNSSIRHALDRKLFGKYRAGALAICGSVSLRPSFSAQAPVTCPECLEILAEAQYGRD